MNLSDESRVEMQYLKHELNNALFCIKAAHQAMQDERADRRFVMENLKAAMRKLESANASLGRMSQPANPPTAGEETSI